MPIVVPYDEFGGDPDSFEIMANFPLPLLTNVWTRLYEPHETKFWQMWARAAGRVVFNIKLSVMWWLNVISCLVKHPVMLWDSNYIAFDGKHRVTGKQMKGWCLSLPQNLGFSSILRLTYTQVSCLKDDLISWFSFQNTGSLIFLSLTSK